MKQRTPYDGKPFYCIECGAGWNEYEACEWPTCKLESEEIAAKRAQETNNANQIHRSH